MKKKIITPEFIFIFYIFGFAMLRPVLFLLKPYSSVIIAAFVTFTIIASLSNSHVRLKRSFIMWLIISAFFELILFVSPAESAKLYMKNYFMYGIVSLFLLINVSDYKLILDWIVKFSCINGALLVLDPFFNYQFNGGYMQYGFNLLMFSFVGLLLGYCYFKKSKFLILIIIELIMISFYGNKGAYLTAMILFLGGMILSGGNIKKIIFSIIACLIMLNWKTFLALIIDFAKRLGVSSYSIATMQMILIGKENDIYSSRTDIWEIAQNWILQEPVFGYGVGVFEDKANGYAHNIFYDITLSFGFVGLFIFIVVTLHSIYKMFINKFTEYKLLQLCCLICWLIPMQFSLTLWNVNLFWVYWGLYLYEGRYRRWKIESIDSNI